MKYLLHIDTSTDAGLITVSGDGSLLGTRSSEETRNHAATINNMIDGVLADANISLQELNGIAVCGGPGSYTGLRIGLATAKGLCYALDIPLILNNRLELLGSQAHRKYVNEYEQYISLLVAREKEYFISIYNNDLISMLPPQHIMETQLNELIDKEKSTYIITNAPRETFDSLKINFQLINTDITLDLKSWCIDAFEAYNCNKTVKLSDAEPFYLKQVYTHK